MQGTSKLLVSRTGYRMEAEMDLAGASGREKGAKPQRIRTTMLGKMSDPDSVYMVDDQNKTYSVWDTKKVREEAGKTVETYTVERLGSDTVAGLSCQKAMLTSSKGSRIEVCVTKELVAPSGWLSAMNRRASGGVSWMSALKENGLDGFPVRWVVGAKNREGGTTMELTRVEKKSLPASLFEVPAGYKKTEYAIGGLTPEQQKALGDAKAQMNDALAKMTPEERKQYEDAMRRAGQPVPTP
jgi:hypothetical protein